MKVKELIAKLEGLNQEADIECWYKDQGLSNYDPIIAMYEGLYQYKGLSGPLKIVSAPCEWFTITNPIPVRYVMNL